MEVKYEFDAVIEKGHGGGAFVKIPFDVFDIFGTRGQVKVKAAFDGVFYRGSIAPMGGCHILGVTQSIRTEIGKSMGESVHVTLELDTEPRVVEVPDALRAALEMHPCAKEHFKKMSYTNRKEVALWVSDAKKEETRERRLIQAIEKLSRGEKPSI
ncbi:MAG: YdeI/OmpD-associated family protein [bacterium]